MVIFDFLGYSADGVTDRETVMRLVIEAPLEGVEERALSTNNLRRQIMTKTIFGRTLFAIALIFSSFQTIENTLAGEDDGLRLQIAKAIQSDEEGRRYFANEDGLTTFLAETLRTSANDARAIARDILRDREHQRYYYFKSDDGTFDVSQQTLTQLLRTLKAR